MIHKESWYKEALTSQDKSNIQAIFESWNIHPTKIEVDLHEVCSIEVHVSEEQMVRIRQNLGKINKDLRTVGWRVIYWRDLPTRVFLHTIVPLSERASYYYHVTHIGKLESIMSKGLLPHRNYEFIKNPRPAIYLTPDYRFLEGQLIPELGQWEDETVILQVKVPDSYDIYPDCEYMHEEMGTAVYVTKRIPPENIQVMSSHLQILYNKAMNMDGEAVEEYLHRAKPGWPKIPLGVIRESGMTLSFTIQDSTGRRVDMGFNPNPRSWKITMPFVELVKWLREHGADYDPIQEVFEITHAGQTYSVAAYTFRDDVLAEYMRR